MKFCPKCEVKLKKGDSGLECSKCGYTEGQKDKPTKKITKEEILEHFNKHPRIRVVKIEDGFLGNASLFKYARDLGNPRGDMYEIAVWGETIVPSGDDIMFAINIPQEAVVIPETMDGIRASLEMQKDRLEAVGITNKYLGLK